MQIAQDCRFPVNRYAVPFPGWANVHPLPVLIIGNYDENGKADAMNAAWCWCQQREGEYETVTVVMEFDKSSIVGKEFLRIDGMRNT